MLITYWEAFGTCIGWPNHVLSFRLRQVQQAELARLWASHRYGMLAPDVDAYIVSHIKLELLVCTGPRRALNRTVYLKCWPAQALKGVPEESRCTCKPRTQAEFDAIKK